MEKEHSVRVQTSLLNAAEKKVLVWLAGKQPSWMTSDILTFVGFIGAIVVAVGYALSSNPAFLWLASFGWFLNWYGDSLDGTLARVRGQQRPVYGFFIDHNVDCINEAIMFIGIGLSPLMNLNIAFLVLTAYLIISIYVYISAHLKGEFKLTYGNMGPTEFRVVVILINTIYLYVTPLRTFSCETVLFGTPLTLHIFDFIALAVLVVLIVIHLTTLIADGKKYSDEDPLPGYDGPFGKK